MSVFYVDFKNGNDAGDGSSLNPFKTPDRALAAVTGGDVVRLRGNRDDPATHFRQRLSIDRAGTVWEADEGHQPTWDGGYKPVYGDWATYALGNSRPGSLYGKMINVREPEVTLRGLWCQNVGGAAFGVGKAASDCLMERCGSDTTYGASLDIGGDSKAAKIAGVTVVDCVFTNSSLAWHAPGQGQKAANAVMIKFADAVVLRRCVVAYAMKEGINADKESDGVVIEDCVIHTINHSGIYVNRARNVSIRRNVVYHTKRQAFLGASYDKRTAPTAIKIGDEGKPGTPAAAYANSFNVQLIGNVVIGGSSCLTVANNPNNYDTQLNGSVIAGNTFIGEVWADEAGESKTQAVIEIFANMNNRPHRESVFQDNLIYAPAGVQLGKISGAGGVTFLRNCWYSADGEAPPVAGDGDVTADPLLMNPDVDFVDVWPAVDGGFRADNYRPLPGSPVIGASTSGGVMGALAPVVEPPDEEEEPEPPDWERMAQLGAAAYGAIVTAEQRLTAAEEALYAVGQELAEARDALMLLVGLLDSQ